jgi:predicted RNase H-like HicB family nuclease
VAVPNALRQRLCLYRPGSAGCGPQYQLPPASISYSRQKIRNKAMQQTYTAVVKREADAWIGWIEEVPGVNCQEATREELLESLRVTLAEAIEFNRADAIDAAGHGFEELPIAV